MADFKNVTQLARELGVSKPAITKAYKSGRLPVADRDKNGHPLFNLEAAKKIWASSSVSSALQRRVDPSTIVVPNGDDASTAGMSDGQRLLKAKADGQERDAEKKALDVATKRGELIAVVDVKAQGAALAKILMGFLTSLPDRLAGQVVDMTDTRDVRDAIFNEVNHMILAIQKQCGFAEPEDDPEPKEG